MNRFASALFAILLLGPLRGAGQLPSSGSPTVTVVGQTAGPTPFIVDLQLSASNVSAIRSIQFEIAPKPGSVTRPVSAVYLIDYLESRGDVDAPYGRITLPVFCLYPDYSNTVNLLYRFQDGSTLQDTVTVATPVFDDPYGYNSPTVVQARTNTTALSYDYFVVKNASGIGSPILVDTDGQVRWIGTNGLSFVSSVFYKNSFFVPAVGPGTTNLTAIDRMELDGTVGLLRDYVDLGVTLVDHHNYDPGKDGFLAEVTTTAQAESIIYELGTSGNLLRVWDFSAIISAAMRAGGDDPSQFVYPAPTDWFHNNAATYRRSDDSLVVSSRENFVICVDYDSGALKWILGDPTKHWYQFPSLRKYALALAPGSLPPVGEHAISFTPDDHLLLFDNGIGSMFQQPPGVTRTYSSPREYSLDLQANVATEVWNYPRDESVLSNFTSSVYADGLGSYLIDYANITVNNVPTHAEFIGLAPSGEIAFDYTYPTTMFGVFAWNAIPIHLENLVFTGPQTTLAAGHPAFFTGETALDSGVYYLDFPIDGNTFGYYAYLTDPHYIYHYGLGYEYVFDAADSVHGVYLYDFASRGFFYTSPSLFPYLYDFSSETTLYYFFDPSHPGTTRYFYDFATGETITK